MQTTCPHCHQQHEIDLGGLIPLTARQHETLEAVRVIARRDIRRTASTRAIASQVGYSERWTLEWLHHLEKVELIHRPKGTHSGWAAKPERPVIVQLRIVEKEMAA
jgi:hypothetical protein